IRDRPSGNTLAAHHQPAAQLKPLNLPATADGQLLQRGRARGELRRDPLSARRIAERPGQPAAVTGRDQVGNLAERHHPAPASTGATGPAAPWADPPPASSMPSSGWGCCPLPSHGTIAHLAVSHRL